MEESEILSHINLNFRGESKKNQTKNYNSVQYTTNNVLNIWDQACNDQEMYSKHCQNQYPNMKLMRKSMKRHEVLDLSSNKQNKNIKITDTILGIIEFNKKIMNLKAKKTKPMISLCKKSTPSITPVSLLTVQRAEKQMKLGFNKLDDIIVEQRMKPCLPKDIFSETITSEIQINQYISPGGVASNSTQVDAKELGEWTNLQLELTKMKAIADLRQAILLINQNNVNRLEFKRTLLNVSQLFSELIMQENSDKADSTVIKPLEKTITQFPNLLQKVTEMVRTLDKDILESETILKTLGTQGTVDLSSPIEVVQSPEKCEQFDKNDILKEREKYLIEGVRDVEKFRFLDIENRKTIEHLTLQSDKYEEHLKEIIENQNNPQNLKQHLKRILEMHAQLKLIKQENDAITKENQLLKQENQTLHSQTTYLYEIIDKLKGEEELMLTYQHDLNDKLKLIEELKGSNSQLRLMFEDNKNQYDIKMNDLLQRLAQQEVQLSKQNIQDSQMKNIQDTQMQNIQDTQMQNILDTQMKNIQDTQVKNIQDTQVKNIQDTRMQNIQNTKMQTNQVQPNIAKYNSQFSQTEGGDLEDENTRMKDDLVALENNVFQLNEQMMKYLNIAFSLNDFLLEICDIEDSRVVQQKLQSQRENILRYYAITSVDIVQNSPLKRNDSNILNDRVGTINDYVGVNQNKTKEGESRDISQQREWSQYSQNVPNYNTNISKEGESRDISQQREWSMSQNVPNYNKNRFQCMKCGADHLVFPADEVDIIEDGQQEEMSSSTMQYALYMQAITIEEMMKQSEQIKYTHSDMDDGCLDEQIIQEQRNSINQQIYQTLNGYTRSLYPSLPKSINQLNSTSSDINNFIILEQSGEDEEQSSNKT